MLYQLLKIPAQLGFCLYTRQITINEPDWLNAKGPLLLACNHPNSFLDAIVICTLFKQPVTSLARGDAFNNKWVAKFLKAIHILPVYRTSEGVENLEHNYSTFDACQQIFRQNGIVLIFCEGLCINEWKLRPLKKGTARLALSSWQQDIDLKVLPVGINYSSFKKFGKAIELNIGKPVSKKNMDIDAGQGKNIQAFNQALQQQLEKLVLQFDKNDQSAIEKYFSKPVSPLKKMLLALPASIGYLLHLPLYGPVKMGVQRRFKRSGHFDSVVVGLLFFAYPVYIVVISLLLFMFTKNAWMFLALAIFPFCAWAYSQLKK